MRKSIALTLIIAFITTSLYIPSAQAGEIGMPRLPAPGVMIHLSPEFTPAHLQGLTIHPDNALQFDFLINKGDSQLETDGKQEEYTKLVKYFLASLTIPDEDQWVNLSPYEHNRIIKDDFGKTEMGRDLLSQDYLLKQITSSLMYPESGLGKKFWDRVYEGAYKEYGTTDVPVNTFNKVWIIPDEAAVYESGNTVYILRNHLKVMLEEDYLSLKKHSAALPLDARNDSHSIGANIVKAILLPELEKEVNEGKNFAMLRQIYSGMILATWYKHALKESLLGRVYANKTKVTGVDQKDPQANEAIYQQYLKAFKKGVFNYIKEDTDKYSQQLIPRKYFAGGIRDFASVATDVTKGFSDAAVVVCTPKTGIPKEVAAKIDFAEIANDKVDQASVALDANRDLAMTDKAQLSGALSKLVLAIGLAAEASSPLIADLARPMAQMLPFDEEAQKQMDIAKDQKKDFKIRKEAVQILGKKYLTSQKVVDVILDLMLHDPDPEMCFEAYAIFSDSDDRIIPMIDIDKLLSAWDNKTSGFALKLEVANLLGRFVTDGRAADRLLALLKDSQNQDADRELVVLDLGRFKVQHRDVRREVNAVLISLLNGNLQDRQIAAKSLGNFNDIVSNIDVLNDHCAKETDKGVKIEIIKSLSSYAPSPKAVDVLIEMYRKFEGSLVRDDIDLRVKVIFGLNLFPGNDNIKKVLIKEWKNLGEGEELRKEIIFGLSRYINDDDVRRIFLSMLYHSADLDPELLSGVIEAFYSHNDFVKGSEIAEILIKKLQELSQHRDEGVRKNVIFVASRLDHQYPEIVLKLYLNAIAKGNTAEAQEARRCLSYFVLDGNPDFPKQGGDLLFDASVRKVLVDSNAAVILTKVLDQLNKSSSTYQTERASILCVLASLGHEWAVAQELRESFEVNGLRQQAIEKILRLSALEKNKNSIDKNATFFNFLFQTYENLEKNQKLGDEDRKIWKLLRRSQLLNIDIPFRFDKETLDRLLTQREKKTEVNFHDYMLVLWPKADWNGAFYDANFIKDALKQGKRVLFFEWGTKQDMKNATAYIRKSGGHVRILVLGGHSNATTTYFGVDDDLRGRPTSTEPKEAAKGELTVSQSDAEEIKGAFEGVLAKDVFVVVSGCSTGQGIVTETTFVKKFKEEGPVIFKWLLKGGYLEKFLKNQYEAKEINDDDRDLLIKKYGEIKGKQILRILQGEESENIVNFLRDNFTVLVNGKGKGHVKVIGPKHPLGMQFMIRWDDNGHPTGIFLLNRKDDEDVLYRVKAFNANPNLPVEIRKWLLPGNELKFLAYTRIGDFDGYSVVMTTAAPIRISPMAQKYGDMISEMTLPRTDAAMKGGIDLNSANLNLQIKRDGNGVPLPLLQQDWAQLNGIQGFIPIIIEIKPVTILPILTELQQKLQQPSPSQIDS